MNRALITFTPLEPYFFGSELTHGDDGANYFAKSNRWPQQSTLCGVIRHLLIEKGFNHGKNSFTPDVPTSNDYGDLLTISPLFMIRNEGAVPHHYLRQALDRHPNGIPFEAILSNEDNLVFSPDRPKTATKEKTPDTPPHQQDWSPAIRWTGFDHKKSVVDGWMRSDGQESIDADDLFLERTRPGITKKPSAARRKREAGFYKQTAYQLKENWCFAVLVSFDDRIKTLDLGDYCLPIGGEKTVFSIKVEAETRAFEDLFPKNMFYPQKTPTLPALILTSDAFIHRDALQYIATGITESVDFRHIRTHADVINFGPLSRDFPNKVEKKVPDITNKMVKSTKYRLFSRGSVLICETTDQLTKLETALSHQETWRNIGFNHFFSYSPISK